MDSWDWHYFGFNYWYLDIYKIFPIVGDPNGQISITFPVAADSYIASITLVFFIPSSGGNSGFLPDRMVDRMIGKMLGLIKK